MNNTEQFDEWIRAELESLDNPPADFRQGEVWKNLVSELPPVATEKRFLVSLSLRSGVVAATIVLVLCGVVWKLARREEAVSDKITQTAPEVVKGAVFAGEPLADIKQKDVEETVTKKQRTPSRKSNEKLTEPILIKPDPTPELQSEPMPVEPISEVAARGLEPVAVTEAPKTASVTKTVTKSKFKIVHANQLEDYEKAEIAESLEKEAKANGFIVIHWKANTDRTSQTNLTTYLKNKSSKAQ